jgi:hypothetical protein
VSARAREREYKNAIELIFESFYLCRLRVRGFVQVEYE